MSVSIVTRPVEPVTGTEWSCAQLPIVYELTNNYFPNNSGDVGRIISSEANDNGFMQLNLSGSLGTFEVLDYVRIAVADIPTGVYQIIAKGSSSQITINYPYQSIANTGDVLLYKNNYHILVEVWCGLTSSHIHAALKPYELAATLKFVPDSGNDIRFSINEIVKGYIELNNNLQLSTLPNNIDFMSMFYIKYAESYDLSDGDTVSTFTSSYTDDSSTFEGFATQSKLPFKNAHSGWMTEYTGSSKKFLTLFNDLYFYPGNYMDVSFINDNPFVTNIYLVTKTYIAGVFQNTYQDTFAALNNEGIFRLEITRIGSEDTQEISLASGLSQTLAPSLWTNGFAPYDPFTSATLTNFIQPTFGVVTGYLAYVALGSTFGSSDVPVNFSLTISGFTAGGTGMTISIGFADGGPSGLIRWISDINIPANTSFNGLYTTDFVPGPSYPGDADTMVLVVTGQPGDSVNIEFSPKVYYYNPASETKTVNIVSDCANQELNIAWLNYLGGFDWHVFTTRKTYSIETTGTQRQRKNIFQDWPTSYGATADTIDRVTKRDSKNILEITSQFVTVDQEDAIKYIMTSPLVQIIVSASDRRTVIVKNTTLPIRRDQDKLRKLTFTLEYTDEIPSQSL